MVQLSNFKNPRWRYTRTAVARNPCVSWVFLLLLPANCVFKLTSDASSTVNCGNWHVLIRLKSQAGIRISIKLCSRITTYENGIQLHSRLIFGDTATESIVRH